MGDFVNGGNPFDDFSPFPASGRVKPCRFSNYPAVDTFPFEGYNLSSTARCMDLKKGEKTAITD
jgi:hypothetical protein